VRATADGYAGFTPLDGSRRDTRGNFACFRIPE
jgi:hypothetical protein